LGRSRGGFSTKIHAVVDTKARPIHIALTPGNQHDSTMAEQLLPHTRGAAVIADTAYDADRIIAAIRERGMKPVIHPNPCRKTVRRLDRKLYRLRYLVECCFHELKRFRAIGTRYDKTARNYLAFVHLACVWLWII
jgi:transposase